MLFAPPFGLLAHGRAVSKDCLHTQARVLYLHRRKKSRYFVEIIPQNAVVFHKNKPPAGQITPQAVTSYYGQPFAISIL